MKNTVPHIAAFLICLILPMVFPSGPIETLAGAIARWILDERMWQCKTRRGG
jgi:hypothetical protein